MPKQDDLHDSVRAIATRQLVAFYKVLNEDVLFQPAREIVLRAFKVKLPAAAHGEYMAICQGEAADGTPMVAFVSGDDIGKVLQRMALMYDDSTLKWRVDQWRIDNAS